MLNIKTFEFDKIWNIYPYMDNCVASSVFSGLGENKVSLNFYTKLESKQYEQF